MDRFKAKDYDAAVRLFEQAYALDPNPNYLFNIGRVYEEKGDIRSAVDYYQRFVKEPGVEIGSRELAVQRLRVLKAILNETETPAGSQSAPQPAAATPPPGEPGRRSTDDPDPKKTMRLGGYALIGVGGISMIVGGIFGGLTLAKKGELNDSHVVEDRKSLAHQGETFAVISDVTLFTGAVLLVTGIALAVVARKPRAAARSAILPSVGRTHAGLSWSLRF
ncbi:tetratricopeptide repeat protein [Nannocystis sp.]|uniref:tetratricopeptide repeat protein n=1 Tax=Nannocystis sp. TaxID=1962667 RepID=UPI0025CD98EB|nr:tetratricopeptide repeat protein [Nannocystis sp.]MBK7826746.1 tetratricopeptide repeat protein [Nannocystis sp.]